MANIPLSPPPLQTDVLFDLKTTNRASTIWSQWFTDIYRIVSPSNHQTITSAYAVSPDARHVRITTTVGTYAITLAAPTLPGVYKAIEMTARTGAFNVTMSLANCVYGSAATTCTWNGAGQTLLLYSLSNKWMIIKEGGVTLV